MKKGITLIELVVSMGIFVIVITIAVGAFVTVSRMRYLTSIMRENQQKTRIAIEMIARLSRQAEKAVTTLDGKELELYFDLDSDLASAVKFEILDGKLLYSHCLGGVSERICVEDNWEDGQNIYGGIVLLEDQESGKDSRFLKKGTSPPTMTIDLFGRVGELDSNPYYSDEINLNTTVILEGLK